MKATNYGFKKAQCDLRIDHYITLNQKKPCTCKFDRFSKLIRHIIAMENRFGRELVWANRNKIPENVMRDREIGDLSSLENESIWKIDFESVTLIDYSSEILTYLKEHGCPCMNHFVLNCKANVSTIECFFIHLNSLERKTQKYLIRKGQVSDIQSNTCNVKSANSQINQSSNTKPPNIKEILAIQTATHSSQDNGGSVEHHNFSKDESASAKNWDSFAAFENEISKKNSKPNNRSNHSTPKMIIKCQQNRLRKEIKLKKESKIYCSIVEQLPRSADKLRTQLSLNSKSTTKNTESRNKNHLPRAEKVSTDSNSNNRRSDHKYQSSNDSYTKLIENTHSKANESIDLNNLVVDEAIDIVFVDKLPSKDVR